MRCKKIEETPVSVDMLPVRRAGSVTLSSTCKPLPSERCLLHLVLPLLTSSRVCLCPFFTLRIAIGLKFCFQIQSSPVAALSGSR